MTRKKRNVRFFKSYTDEAVIQSSLDIFNVLKKEKAISLSEISKRTRLSNDIVSGYINACVKNGLLKLSATGKGDVVEFAEDDKKVLGVGFNGMHCTLSVMTPGGGVTETEIIDIKPFSEFKGRIKELKEIVEAVKNTKFKDTGFCFAGVAIPERLNEMNPKSIEILGEGISRIFGCDVLVTFESTACGYGERDFSDHTKGKDILYMHSDVGIGVIIKGEMIFEANDNRTWEGKAYLRPWGQFDIVETAKALVNKGLGTSMVDMVKGNVENIDLKVVFSASENKDELAEDLVKRSALALGVRAAYLVNMFRTGTIVLGGGTEQKEGGFLSSVEESAKRFLLKDMINEAEIIPGVLGKDAPSIGAASLCRRELFMEV